jgi:hypothetical protein
MIKSLLPQKELGSRSFSSTFGKSSGAERVISELGFGKGYCRCMASHYNAL